MWNYYLQISVFLVVIDQLIILSDMDGTASSNI